jgi:pimeloyl-ACP methyl ester carboxylesterase
MSEEKGRKNLGKAAKLLGDLDQAPQAMKKEGTSEGKLKFVFEPEPDFKDTETKLSDKKLAFPALAQFFGKQLLSARANIEDQDYQRYLRSAVRSETVSNYNPLSIKTRDGTTISALEIGDPSSDKCIVVFQGKDANYKSQESLERLFEIARETGARVIAFNYRDTPKSHDSFLYDGAAVTRHLLNQNIPPKNITLYGESMGGAVAAETAAKFKSEETIDFKAFIARTPKSLSYAGKYMDLETLQQESPKMNEFMKKEVAQFLNVEKNLKRIQSYTPRVLVRNVIDKLFGKDFDAQTAINKLDAENVVILRVDKDPVVTQAATAGHDEKTTVLASTALGNKHNVGLSQLEIKSENNSDKKKTALDLLREFSNPGYNPEQKRSAKNSSK